MLNSQSVMIKWSGELLLLNSIVLSWTCSVPLLTISIICNDFLSFSGPATHHRPVRGSQRWTQPHLAAGGAVWRDTGKLMLMWDQISLPQPYSKPNSSNHQSKNSAFARLTLTTWICSLNISPSSICVLLLYRPYSLCLSEVTLEVCIWLDSPIFLTPSKSCSSNLFCMHQWLTCDIQICMSGGRNHAYRNVSVGMNVSSHLPILISTFTVTLSLLHCVSLL